MKIFRIISFTIALFVAPVAGAQEQEDTVIENGQAIESPQPVQETDIMDDQVVFSLADSDILAWEQSGEGKYIYFTISDEKNEELAALTESHLGRPMTIHIGDLIVFVPEITNVISQKDGFVLQAKDSQRQELMLMLDNNKRRDAVTEINVPVIADTETERQTDVKQPVPLQEAEPQETGNTGNKEPDDNSIPIQEK